MESNILQKIQKFNAGRTPQLLQVKYQTMRENIFSFYRGSAHLFYSHLKKTDIVYKCPNTWICGDLHFENFGSFKGDNGLVYFDINDFDEAVLGPCLFDVARFIVSLRLIGALSGISNDGTQKLCKFFIDVYCHTLLSGNSRWVEKETAKGIVKQLLTKVARRKPKADIYSARKGKHRKLDFKNKKLLVPNDAEKAAIRHLVAEWNKKHKARAIYDIIDIGYHLKGTGSLGIERYVLLVQKKANKKYKLIDLKMATPSCVAPRIENIKQPEWCSEAERTIEIQKRMQGTYQALLQHISYEEKGFVLREYQSMEDKIDYKLLRGNVKDFKTVIGTMARVTAWGQLQSGGRQGSAITDELMDFAKKQAIWQPALMAFADQAVATVKEDYRIFCEAYDKMLVSKQALVF